MSEKTERIELGSGEPVDVHPAAKQATEERDAFAVLAGWDYESYGEHGIPWDFERVKQECLERQREDDADYNSVIAVLRDEIDRLRNWRAEPAETSAPDNVADRIEAALANQEPQVQPDAEAKRIAAALNPAGWELEAARNRALDNAAAAGGFADRARDAERQRDALLPVVTELAGLAPANEDRPERDFIDQLANDARTALAGIDRIPAQQIQPDGGEREASGIGEIDCPNCDGCGWNEGSPASTCQLCGGSGHVCGTCNGRLTADEYEFNDETRKLERIVLGPCPACALADHQPSKEGEAVCKTCKRRREGDEEYGRPLFPSSQPCPECGVRR